MTQNAARSDPVERIIAEALDRAGIRYVGESDPLNTAKLDFYLPDHDVYVECKRFATDRTARQLERADNVVLIQGIAAAEWFAGSLKRSTNRR